MELHESLHEDEASRRRSAKEGYVWSTAGTCTICPGVGRKVETAHELH